MELLRKALQQDNVLLDIRATNLKGIFRQALDYLVHVGDVSSESRDYVEAQLLQRERQTPTAIGHSVAVPHIYLDEIGEKTVLFVRLKHAVNLGAPDGIPTRFMVFLLGPLDGAADHLDTLSVVARLMSDEEFRFDAAQARSASELSIAFDSFLQRTAYVAPAPVDDGIRPGMQYTGRLCGGMLEDFQRRAPLYVADFVDGFSRKAISSTLFLYFACIAPAVIFGGGLAAETNNQIGVIEIILATALCGIVYALFCGQPLVILGGTGPLLIFTVILFELCETYGGTTLPWLGTDVQLPFLETRAGIGLIAAAIILLFAVLDASCLMRFFTRFTDEIFVTLISIIFIQEAVLLLYQVFERTWLPAGDPQWVTLATALMSLLLALGTFFLAFALTRIRRSRYLMPSAREFLADFGPAISLAVMTLIAIRFVSWYSGELTLDRLDVHSALTPSIDRSWLLNPLVLNWKVWIVATVPGLLLALLVFADQNITARLVNSPDHNLRKGPAYHWDLALTGILVGVCSIFGWPWVVAATVRSLNHVRSLATVEEVVTPGGTTKEKIIKVQETRVTGLAIHVLILLSVLLLPILRHVPMVVLYGLFLFMGVISLGGNQFFERLSLWIMDTKLYPSNHYTRRVPHRVIHQFTLLQAVCLGVLVVVKHSAIAILFPLFLVLFIPIRFWAKRFFASEYLDALDSDETPEEEAYTTSD